MSRVVTASFLSREDAEEAAERLVEAGVSRAEISMLAPEENGGTHSLALQQRRTFLAGVGGGALLGLGIGAVCGALLALLPVSIAELDRLGVDFADSGPIVSALAGAGIGAALIGLLGGLLGLSRTHHEAVMRDADEIGAGGHILVGVAPPREMMRSARHLLASTGAHQIKRG